MLRLGMVLCLFWAGGLQAVSFNGTSEYAQRYVLSPPVSGVVSAIHVSPGQRVSAGERLLELQSQPFEAEVALAQARRAEKLPALEAADLDLQRAEEMYDRGVLSDMDLQTAERGMQAAQAAIDAAEAALQMAQIRSQQSRLQAPVDGMVSAVAANPGQFHNADLSPLVVVEFVDPSRLLARVKVSASQWRADRIGSHCKVRYQGKTYSGTIVSQSVVADTASKTPFQWGVLFVSEIPLPVGLPVTVELP